VLADTCRKQGKPVRSCRCDVLCGERLEGTFGIVPSVRDCSILLARGHDGFTVPRLHASYRFVDGDTDPAAGCKALGPSWSLITDGELTSVQLDLFHPMLISGGRAVDSCLGDDCIGVAIGAGSGCPANVWAMGGSKPHLVPVMAAVSSSARIVVCRRDVPS